MNSQPEPNPLSDIIDQQAIISVIEKVTNQSRQDLFTRQETFLIWQALLRLYFDQYPAGTNRDEQPGAVEQQLTEKLLKQLDREMSAPMGLE